MSSGPGWRACRPLSLCARRATPSRFSRRGRPPAADAGHISTANLDCASTTATICCLSGNRSAFAYLDTIGARSTLTMPAEPVFPFMDLSYGQRWVLRPNLGRVPWWVLSRTRRVPGTRVTDLPGPASAAPHQDRCRGRHFAAQRYAVPAAGRTDRHRGAEHATRRRAGAAARHRDARDAVPGRRRLHSGSAAARGCRKA